MAQKYKILTSSTDSNYNALEDEVEVRVATRIRFPPREDLPPGEIVEDQANNINGHYPVYTDATLAQSASSDGIVRDVGNGFFMPNQLANGQIYYGNYVPPTDSGSGESTGGNTGGSDGNVLVDDSITPDDGAIQ